jgi:hypothetical protein
MYRTGSWVCPRAGLDMKINRKKKTCWGQKLNLDNASLQPVATLIELSWIIHGLYNDMVMINNGELGRIWRT